MIQSQKLKNECTLHKGRSEVAICFNESCFKKSRCCSSCLLETHKDCPKELILLCEELNKNISINSDSENVQGKEFIRFLIERKAHFIKKFDELISEAKQLFDPVSYQDLLHPSKFEVIKKNSDIKFDKNSNKVTVTHFGYLRKLEITDYLKRLKDKLNDDNLLGFKNLTIPKESWKRHWSMDMDIEMNKKGTLITKAEKSWNGDNFISKSGSLVSHCKYKMTIKNITNAERALFIGVVPEEGLDKLGEKFYDLYFQDPSEFEELEFNCFSGIDCFNMKGKVGENGFVAGVSYYIEFIPKQRVRIYDESGNVNVVGNLLDADEPYYLFLHLGEDPVSVFIERVF